MYVYPVAIHKDVYYSLFKNITGYGPVRWQLSFSTHLAQLKSHGVMLLEARTLLYVVCRLIFVTAKQFKNIPEHGPVVE